MSDLRTMLERGVGGATPPPDGYERMLRRRDRKRRNQRMAAGILGFAVFVAAIWIVTSGLSFDRAATPAVPGPTGPADPSQVDAPEVDYVIDLNSGAMTPLPEAIAIIRSAAMSTGAEDRFQRYAASSDGSLLAYVGTGDDENPQIFIAGVDGTEVRQMTQDPTGATSPAWSPDGSRIAYVGYGSGYVRNIFVLDVATAQSTQVTDGIGEVGLLQFAPDGSSLLYTGGTGQVPLLKTVPVTGGKSTLVIHPEEGLPDAGDGSLSPDGSVVTFLGGTTRSSPLPTTPRSGPPVVSCGPCRWVANADGTGRRVLSEEPGCWVSNPAGTWSPDGSRIVCSGDWPNIVVVDIATGDASSVAQGSAAIWLDDHTLLVSV